MKVYIDNDFKCHVTNDGTMTAVEDEFFDGKCDTFIEGFRLKPYGKRWVRSDGEVFEGPKMISPWKDYDELDAAQHEYERQLIATYEKSLETVGVVL
jgi:hypothetical protein